MVVRLEVFGRPRYISIRHEGIQQSSLEPFTHETRQSGGESDHGTGKQDQTQAHDCPTSFPSRLPYIHVHLFLHAIFPLPPAHTTRAQPAKKSNLHLCIKPRLEQLIITRPHVQQCHPTNPPPPVPVVQVLVTATRSATPAPTAKETTTAPVTTRLGDRARITRTRTVRVSLPSSVGVLCELTHACRIVSLSQCR